MSNNENKTDGDIVATLIGARIPKAYHIKGMSLKDSETGERLMDFLDFKVFNYQKFTCGIHVCRRVKTFRI